MGNEHPARQRPEQSCSKLREAGGISHHVVRDVGDRADGPGYGTLRIYQRFKHDLAALAVDHRDGDLGDPVSV
jgi:hypothetical protein